MAILVSVLIGILVAIITFILINNFSYSKLPKLDFKNKQAAALQGLKEKKDAQTKEINDQVEAEKERLYEMLKRKQFQIAAQEQQLDQSFIEKKNIYEKNYMELEKSYENRQKQLNEAEEQNKKDFIARYSSEIKNLEKEHNNEISKKKAKYEKERAEMDNDFLAYSAEINMKKEALTKEIANFEQKQKAIIERFKHDEETRQKADFYHITIDGAAQKDISQLKVLALNFSRPEVLYKILYEVYYKALMEELFKRVLGENKDKGGIYKITNINNQKVYIGKTTKFIDRWRTHAKRGCGIERIKGQLYDALFKEGLENFTWEIVEVCDKEKQTEREKYWTSFYQSETWGYNMKNG